MTEWVYKGGKRHGIALGYFKSRQLKDKGRYLDDKLDGPVIKYYPDGQLKMEMQFKNDLPNGKAKVYDKQGILQKEFFYSKGNLTRQKLYDAQGTVIQDRTFDRPIAPP